MAIEPADIVGWWDLAWKGGAFEVCFRPAGKFFCPKFQDQARWEIEEGTVKVDWGKFGKYEFVPGDKKCLDGWAVPKNPADESNWRKATFNRPLSPEEFAIIGDGAGSEWEFEHPGGSFPIKFKADAYNHFNCDDFPAHAHWSIQGSRLRIVWGDFGTYDLDIVVDGETKSMKGGPVGGDWEKDWRKATHSRNLLDNQVMEACEHHH